MNKVEKVIITFIISFLISYIIFGYLKSNFAVAIHWVPEATMWDKLREYYIRTFSFNILPATLMAIVATFVIRHVKRK